MICLESPIVMAASTGKPLIKRVDFSRSALD